MALCSFVLWGVFPVYFYWLRDVSASEILAHRIVWSMCLLVGVGLVTGAQPWRRITVDKFSVVACIVSALLLSINWLIYIWAVGNQMALEGSLGYFINPLVSVLLAVVILKESLSRFQLIAILIAATAVGYLIVLVGEIPWVALSLAVAFGLYGLIHKKYNIDAMGGLTIETMLLAPFAIAYLAYLFLNDNNVFLSGSPRLDVLLLCAGPITSLPLLLYLKGLSRLRLSTVALMQYVVPSLQFIVAIYVLGEPLSREKLFAFVLIWLALLVFSADILKQRSRNSAIRAPQSDSG